MAPRRGRNGRDLRRDERIVAAVSRISERAEMPAQSEVLTAMFVDPGVVRQLDNDSHQILMGRRGTGKTHVLRVMEQRFRSRPSQLAIYADLTRLGSTDAADAAAPERTAAALLVDLLTLISDGFRARARVSGGFAFARAGNAIDAFANVVEESGFAKRSGTRSSGVTHRGGRSGQAGLSIGTSGPTKVDLGAKAESSHEHVESEQWTLEAFDRVEFTAVSKALEGLVVMAGLERLALLIDEWVEVPYTVQPYLAEFVKRCFFAVPRVTVKIAAIEHRSQFGTPLERNATRGFELQADVFTVSALDETYFFYDRDPKQVKGVLADLLYRHVTVEAAILASRGDRTARIRTATRPGFWRRTLDRVRGRSQRTGEQDPMQAVAAAMDREGWAETFMEGEGARFMREVIGVEGPDEFVAALFAPGAFDQLARAAQGVARDFLVIFAKAFNSASEGQPIDRIAIRRAMNDVYADKLASLDADARERFARITQAIFPHGQRAFLADDSLRSDDRFQSLVDKRVVHPLNRRYADPLTGGRLFGIYTVDYASYAQLLDQGRLSDDDFAVTPGNDTVAPFDDHRAMRRRVLRLDDLVG
jgi:hypothetical protein